MFNGFSYIDMAPRFINLILIQNNYVHIPVEIQLIMETNQEVRVVDVDVFYSVHFFFVARSHLVA